jgi:hypothetical protein
MQTRLFLVWLNVSIVIAIGLMMRYYVVSRPAVLAIALIAVVVCNCAALLGINLRRK